jgi:hypothetical protein
LNRKLWMAMLLVLSTARSVAAQDAADLIAQGLKLRKDNRDEDALPLFRQAYQEQPSPRAAGQLGTCEQALGLWVGAETHIRAALKHGEDEWVRRNDSTLRSALTYVEQRLGWIEVWGNPVGARVTVDGDVVGTLPMSRRARVSTGQRSITVEATGFLAERRTVEVLSGALVREHVVLRSIPAVPAATVSTPLSVALPSVDMETVPVETAEATPAPTTTPIYKSGWFWAAVGAVAVVAGATGVFLVTRGSPCQSPMGVTCETF